MEETFVQFRGGVERKHEGSRTKDKTIEISAVESVVALQREGVEEDQ